MRERLDPFKLKVPVFGNLFKKIAIARFTRNFGTMIHAGVPILQALDIVGETSGNLVIERAAKAVQESVRSGNSLTGPLSQHPVFPPMVVQMMAVGEDTGALDTMLEKIAEFYDQEVEATTEQLTSPDRAPDDRGSRLAHRRHDHRAVHADLQGLRPHQLICGHTCSKTADAGFSLIELLVVIIIIGILAAIAIPTFLGQRRRPLDASVKSDLRTLATAIEAARTVDGDAPDRGVRCRRCRRSSPGNAFDWWWPETDFCLAGVHHVGPGPPRTWVLRQRNGGSRRRRRPARGGDVRAALTRRTGFATLRPERAASRASCAD